MAGKKQFVPDEVLRQATDLFRRGGFAGSSIDDLIRETGVARSSLYATFGTKEELFLQAFGLYCDEMMQRLSPRDDLKPIPAVREFMLDILDTLESWGELSGCLVTNTCAEYASSPESIQSRCHAALRAQEIQLESFFERCLARGDLPPDMDPTRMARFFVALRQTIGLLWKSGQSKRSITEVIDTSLKVLSN